MDAMRTSRLIPVALTALLLAWLPLLFAQAAGGKRLILKDGTYQIVAKYEVMGNRVRYLSAERDDWEELPYSLVDWPATNQWNKEHAPGAKPKSPAASGSTGAANPGENEAAAIDRAAAAERADQRARMPTVAPGLQLPDEDGVFVLDNFQNIPELVVLQQSSGDVNQGGTHSVLRAAIDSFRGAQEPVRINGQAARVRVHVDDPTLYVSLDTGGQQIAPESAFVVDTHGDDNVTDKNSYSSPESRYAIVRVQVMPGERVIGALRLRRLNGQITQSEDIVPTTATIVPGRHWMKLTPKEPLTVGEYALMEILGPGEINLDVWDFGVNPDAPENQHPITPVKSAQ